MPALHVINRPVVGGCEYGIAGGDVVLLIENGVYDALSTGNDGAWRAIAALGRVYVLEPHLSERGLLGRPLLDGVRLVDFGGFVDLARDHEPIVSWG